MLNNLGLWLSSLAIFAALVALGYFAAQAWVPHVGAIEKLALGYGLGIGLLSWLSFIISWLGFPLGRTSFSLAYLILLITFFVISRFSRRAARRDEMELPQGWQRILDSTCWLLLAGLGMFLLVISVGRSYGGWDAMAIWSVKGYGIALERTVFAGAHWGSKGLAYPLNLPLTIGLFFTYTRDLLPGSKLIFPGFLVAMLAGIRLYLYRLRIPAWLAWLAVLIIVSAPLILVHSLNGYANVPFAFYYVIGLLWIGLGIFNQDKGRLVIGGLLLALAGWTRIEGVEFWLIAMSGLALVWRQSFFHKNILLPLGLPALVILGAWVIFSRLVHATSTESSVLFIALQQNLQGHLHPAALLEILRYTAWSTIRYREWGYALPLVMALGTVFAFVKSSLRSDKLLISPIVLGLLSALGVVLMYYFSSYDPHQSLQYWLGSGYSRMLIGAVCLMMTSSLPAFWRFFTA